MYIGILIYFGINFLSAVGYSDILCINSDRKLFWYFWLTALVPIGVFFFIPSVMRQLLIGEFIYQVLGLILYIIECRKYKRNEERQKEIERESW
jgi:hypothetical protein